MDYSKKSETVLEYDLSNYSTSMNSEAADNISTQDDVKVKVEIELKEAESDLVYQPDFYGHLRLVNLNEIASESSNDKKNKDPDVSDWSYFHQCLPRSQANEDVVVPTDESSMMRVQSAYEHLSNIYGFSKERNGSSFNSFQESVFSPSVLYKSLHKDLCKEEFPDHVQDSEYVQKKKELSSVLAEKKRNYRNKIKEENPAMWTAMKQKEACKKREQREEKRFILLEMQRLMHMLSLPESPETEKNKACLQTLKDRYPDIWKQLLDALSAAEQRNSDLLEGTTCNKKRSKPMRAYKDIVEAQKKYLYRQRMKLERPDLYEQQKARDSYARSIRRMLKKQFTESHNILDSDINNLDSSVNCNINLSHVSNNSDDSNLNEVHNVNINL